MGREDESMAQYKKIYEVDISYRDVKEIMDNLYQKLDMESNKKSQKISKRLLSLLGIEFDKVERSETTLMTDEEVSAARVWCFRIPYSRDIIFKECLVLVAMAVCSWPET